MRVQLLWYSSAPCRPVCDITAPLAPTVHCSSWTRASPSYRCSPARQETLSLPCCGNPLRAGRLWRSTPSTLSSGQALAFSLRKPLLSSWLVSTVTVQTPRGPCHTEPFRWAWKGQHINTSITGSDKNVLYKHWLKIPYPSNCPKVVNDWLIIEYIWTFQENHHQSKSYVT